MKAQKRALRADASRDSSVIINGLREQMMDEIPSQDGTLDSTLPLETKFEETRVQYEQKINRATNAPIQRVKKRGKKLNQDK